MTKKIILTALILGIFFTFTACRFNKSSEKISSDSQVTDEQDTSRTSDNSETTDNNSETTDSNLTASGGNPDIAVYIDVTVSENKYFYQNHEILYDDLIKVFDELNENTIVRINDENATLRAYESLTKTLEERGILFEEVK